MSTEFRIRLADVNIRVCCLHESTRRFCVDYLIGEEQEVALSGVDNSCESPSIEVRVVQEDIKRERVESEAYARGRGEAVRQWSDEYLETLALYRKIVEELADHDIVLIHGSAICVDGQAYLFTASSGTGKSTHAALWRAVLGEGHEVSMINDDKQLMRIGDKEIIVYGSPWDGKHRLSADIQAPLRAIGRVIRSETNYTEPMKAEELWPTILRQCYRPDDAFKLQHILTLLDRLKRKIPFYDIHCNTEPAAALSSWLAMQYKETDK